MAMSNIDASCCAWSSLATQSVGDDDVVVAEHRVAGGRLDAALGRAAATTTVLMPLLRSSSAEVGAPERARPVLLDHQLAVARLQAGHELWPSEPSSA